MTNTSANFLFAALALLASSIDLHARSTKEVATVYIDVNKATVIGFLPLAMKNSRDREAFVAENLVSLAINNARICLGDDYATYRVVFADRIVLRAQGRERSFELGTAAPLVGALLFGPSAPNPRILFAGGGPEALLRMLHPAASEYFGKQCGS